MAIKTSLVSVWELNEASGNAVDSHGSNTLTETSGTIAAGAGVGNLSGSRDFEAGDTEYFEKADNSDLSCDGTTFAITAWINFESIASGTQSLVCKGNLDAASSTEYGLFYTGGATSRFRLGVSTGSAVTFRNADAFGAASTATWYFVYAYYNTSTNELGISVNNGTVNTTSYSSGVGATAQAFRLGSDNSGGLTRVFDGLMAQVALWKRVLTSDEVTLLYNSGNGLPYVHWDKSASAAVTVGAATCSGSATFSGGAGTFTGSAAVTIGAATASGSATFAPGTKTGSAAVTVGAATASGSATFTAPGTVSITNIEQYEFRQISSGVADITIAGNRTSGEPVRARYNGGSWATIDSGAGTTYSGTLTNQAAGSGLLEVSLVNFPGVTASVADVRLTNGFAWAGDSRADGRLTSTQSGNVSAYTQDDVYVGADPCDKHASNGTFCPLVSALHEAKFGYPCGFITVGTGSTDCYGTGSATWGYGNSDYNALLTQITDSGVNAVKGVIMFLGPNAIVNATTPTQANYNAAIDAMANGFATDIAGAPKTIIDVCGEVGTGTPPDRRLAQDNVRAAIIQARGDNANVTGIYFQQEENYTDNVHPVTNAQALRVARRLWMAIEDAWFSGTYGRGPRVSGTALINSALDTITITVDRDLASGTTYGGFRVEDSGVSVSITSVTRTSARVITIVLAAPASAAANVTWSFASNDDAVGQTIPTSTALTLPDSSTEVLPMETVINAAVVEAYAGSAAVTVGAATASGSATFTAPVYTGSAAVTIGRATCSGSALFTAPVYTAAAAVTVGAATASGSATFTTSLHTASAAVTVGRATCSGSATFTSPATSSGPISILAYQIGDPWLADYQIGDAWLVAYKLGC